MGPPVASVIFALLRGVWGGSFYILTLGHAHFDFYFDLQMTVPRKVLTKENVDDTPARKSKKNNGLTDDVRRSIKAAANTAAGKKAKELTALGVKPAVAKTAIRSAAKTAAFDLVSEAMGSEYADSNKEGITKVWKNAAERECTIYQISDTQRKQMFIKDERHKFEELLACFRKMEANTAGTGFCSVALLDHDDNGYTLMYVPIEMMPVLHGALFDHNGAQGFFENSSPIINCLRGNEVDDDQLRMELLTASNPFSKPMSVSEFRALLEKIDMAERFELGEPTMMLLLNRKKHIGNVFSDEGDDYKKLGRPVESSRPFYVGKCIKTVDGMYSISSKEEEEVTDEDSWEYPHSLWCKSFKNVENTLWHPSTSACGVHNVLSANYQSDKPLVVGEEIKVGGKKYLVRLLVESYVFSDVLYQDILVDSVE